MKYSYFTIVVVCWASCTLWADIGSFFRNIGQSISTTAKDVGESVQQAAHVKELQIKRTALAAAYEAARKALELAQGAASSLRSPSIDPEVLSFRSGRALLDAGIAAIAKLNPQGTEVKLFACHGMAKAEFYRDQTHYLPEQLNFLKPALTKISAEFKEALFGKSTDIGNLIPYPSCLLDASPMSVKEFFTIMRQFLDKNPGEVITLSLNDMDLLYQDKAAADIKKDFSQSGLEHYAHIQDVNQPWPTLEQMVNSGKRLVVFADSNNPNISWAHWWPNFKPWAMTFSIKSPEEITRPYVPSQHFKGGTENIRDTSPAQNKIFVISHSTTPGLAGTKKDAAIMNSKQVLEKHIINLSNTVNHMVNFLHIDFYEYPSMDVFDVEDHLNGVGKYQGNPLWRPSK
jgi:hypothetical protein